MNIQNHTKKIKFQNSTETLFINIELNWKKYRNAETNKIFYQRVFSCSGSLYDNLNYFRDRYLISCGQNLDCIPDFVKTMQNKKDINKLLSIYNLWKKYHLNDMHADCEHAINEKLCKDIIIYEYQFKGFFNQLERKIKLIENNKYLSDNIKINNKLKMLQKYRYNFKTELKFNQLPKTLKRFYELKNKEIKNTNWINFDKELTPSGILCKPCPICGYKYGTSWNYRPIPKKDITKILTL